MRVQRDRFVAFAFCAADILLELDARHTVTYAGGATVALTGRAGDALVGASIFDLVPEYDREPLRGLLERAAAGHRVEHNGLRLSGLDGPTFPMTLTGYYLPDLQGSYFIALRIEMGVPAVIADKDGRRDPESGLRDAGSFAEASEAHLHRARRKAEDVLMTVFDIEDLKSLRSRLDEEARAGLMFTLGDYLRSSSVDGDSAARFKADRYGLLHRPDLDVQSLRKKIADFAREIDPAGDGVSVTAGTVDIDSEGLSETDAARSLIYAIKQFDEREGESLTIGHLSDGLTSEMAETARDIKNLRAVITSHSFDFAFQPIVHLDTRRIHHFEALLRLPRVDKDHCPSMPIRFAEEVGMIADLDLAMCQRVTAWLDRNRQASKDYAVAVNLSARSLGSHKFADSLLTLLRKNRWADDRLLFELTETASIPDLEEMNQTIQRLRKLGHWVCLDDFGAGEAAFQYLRALKVDMVKIDGSYVREAFSVANDRHFLKAIVGLCEDLSITTAAEMIEDDGTLALVRDCGVKFGQGHLFGRPSLDITAFDSYGSSFGSAD
jgi:EAL domain-containing protein (putative c-di-GMP-specific phosphodiesterase class I)/PAS domain-containing protein